MNTPLMPDTDRRQRALFDHLASELTAVADQRSALRARCRAELHRWWARWEQQAELALVRERLQRGPRP